MNRILFVLLTICLSSENAFAHPYLNLKEGDESVYDYSFTIDTKKKEFKQSDVKGKMISRAMGWIERNGKKYLHYETSYEGIPYMKEKASLWRREDSNGVYLAAEIREKFVETLELPSDVSVNSEWDYDDGVKSKRKVTANIEFTTPKGEKLADCIEVSRQTLGQPKLSKVVNKVVYCKDRRDVSSLFIQPSPVGDYRTEAVQRDYQTK